MVDHICSLNNSRTLADHDAIYAILGRPSITFDLINNLIKKYYSIPQGSENNQGLTEVIAYFIRLIINCAILIHILPLAIKWRREKKILKQLESLASRLQLTSPPATCELVNNGTLQRVSTSSGKEMENDNFVGAMNGCSEKYIGGIDNRSYMHSCFGSQNEFDASIFGMNPSQYIGPPINTPLGMNKSFQCQFNLFYF